MNSKYFYIFNIILLCFYVYFLYSKESSIIMCKIVNNIDISYYMINIYNFFIFISYNIDQNNYKHIMSSQFCSLHIV